MIKCTVCGGTDFTEYDTGDDANYAKCDTCAHEFSLPPKSEHKSSGLMAWEVIQLRRALSVANATIEAMRRKEDQVSEYFERNK